MPPGRPRKNKDSVLIKSAEMLGWALGGIEREIGQTRERLATLMAHAAKLRAGLGVGLGRAAAASAPAAKPAAKVGKVAKVARRKRRKLSPEARKRISDNMRKRWAETKKAGKRRL